MPFSKSDFLSLPLWPLSALFGGMMEIRNFYFDHGILPIVHLPRPVISVGNISVGGTGKTPLVHLLAHIFNGSNKRVAVLTRGYGRKSGQTLCLDKTNLDKIAPVLTGDEPRILARHLENGVVIVDGNRLRGSKMAMRKANKPDLFILDDAFQHRQIDRDVNIVTLDATDLWGRKRLLPAGKLREPLTRLRRADLIWITRLNQTKSSLAEIRGEVEKKLHRPVVYSDYSPAGIVNINRSERLPLTALEGKKVIAFAGIANPKSFLHTLESLAAKVVFFRPFKDHHFFKRIELMQLLQQQEDSRADWLITTEKDAERMDPAIREELPNLYFMEIEIKIVAGEANLKKMFDSKGLI